MRGEGTKDFACLLTFWWASLGVGFWDHVIDAPRKRCDPLDALVVAPLKSTRAYALIMCRWRAARWYQRYSLRHLFDVKHP